MAIPLLDVQCVGFLQTLFRTLIEYHIDAAEKGEHRENQHDIELDFHDSKRLKMPWLLDQLTMATV